jgi:hypothetical protein
MDFTSRKLCLSTFFQGNLMSPRPNKPYGGSDPNYLLGRKEAFLAAIMERQGL